MSEIYTDPPQSRNEAIIKATIDGTEYTAPPQSRMEDLLLELKEVIEQGGGGGTRDYSQLTHKPSINDVELSGNKTASDLGLMPAYEVDTTPTESSENLITSGGVWTADKNINNKLQGSKTAGSTDGSPFEIPDYGMTESIQMYFKPTQDLHGYDKPWAGGAGKNKLPLTVDGLKASNTGGTWSGNTYSVNGATYNIETDIDGNVTSISGVGNGSSGSNLYLYFTLQAGSYSMTSGFSENQGANDTILLNSSSTVIARGNSGAPGQDFTLNEASNVTWIFRVTGTYTSAFICTPMIRLSTESDADFEPYSNICPISGQDSATFEWTDSHDIENEVTMNFGQTYYGGFCQFATGAIYSEWDYIASYNGETLSGEWVSDRDEYTAGTTPTIGAEVAYKTTPTYARVTPPANLNLTDDYPIEYNGYMANISYQPKNTVLAEAKRYTNQEIAKLGLPQPPTTDGTYHLECSVSGGIPTIRWVSNS